MAARVGLPAVAVVLLQPLSQFAGFHANDRFREARYLLENSSHRRAYVVFRCYNDAIALCYELPASEAGTIATITEETTSFGVEGNTTAYIQQLENYKTSHEHNVTTTSSVPLEAVMIEQPSPVVPNGLLGH